MASRGLSRLVWCLQRQQQQQQQQHYLNLFRAFSASATATDKAPEAAPKKRKCKKKKNFLDVAQFLPSWGIGAKFSKTHWPLLNFYRITDVKVYKDGRHGAAWGIFYNSGAPMTGQVEKIGGVNKRCWRYIEEPVKVWKRA